MARIPRKNYVGQYFHVMVQGIGKEYIFPDNDSKGYYLRCIQKNKEKYPVALLAFCVMGNHAHIFVSVKNVSELSKFVQYTNADYSAYYNRVRKRVGYVFRGRFKSEAITEIGYLTNCLAYIHNNPIVAGIVAKAEEYEYSSYVNYLRKSGIVDFGEAQKLFDTSAENIRAIMDEKTDTKWLEHIPCEYENAEKVLGEFLRRNKTKKESVKNSLKQLKSLSQELKERCGTSLREQAILLEMGRETLRKRLSSVTSP